MASQRAVVLIAASMLHMVTAGSDSTSENPIRKVVRLMQDMQKEIEGELEKEKGLFEKFECICTTADDELAAAAEKASGLIKSLTSKLEEESAEKAQLTEELKGHVKDKESSQHDLDKATSLREKEQEETQDSIADSQYSVKALGKAIPAIERGTAGAATLMQAEDGGRFKKVIESTQTISAFDRRELLAFINAGTGSSTGDDAPQSSQVLGILKQMKDDMQKNLDESIENEKVAAVGYADLKAAKGQEIDIAEESIESKEKRTGELAVSISQNTDALEDSQNEYNDASQFLATLKRQCTERQGAWEGRLKLRNEEITAIGEAIGILNDDEALDVFKKAVPASLVDTMHKGHKYGFLQKAAKASKLQRAQSIIATASQFYKNSQMDLLLNAMNSKLKAAHKGNGAQAPDFSNVVKMIANMMDVLGKEQAEDEKKKKWCNAEMSKSEGEERMKQEEMDSLSSGIEELSDEISSISEEVKTHEQEIAELDKSVADATEQRKKEHAEYSDTLAMTQAAVALVGKAKDRLAKFYKPKKAAEEQLLEQKGKATKHVVAFVQLHRNVVAPPPDLPDLPEYKPQASGGIVGIMDTIIHELESDMAEAGRDEASAQKDYVALMSESQVSRAQDTKSIEDKNSSRAVLEEKLAEAKEARKMAFDQLNNIHEYVSELHGSCDFIVENFDLRREARSNEMESLKNAKAVMQGADF